MADRVRLRVRTSPARPGCFPRGQDTVVEVIDAEGNAKMVEGITALTIRVSARSERVGIALEGNFELDVEGEQVKEPKRG